MDSHFISVPSIGTFSTRTLSGGDSQGLGRNSYWALYLELVVLGGIDNLGAGGLQRLHVQTGDRKSIWRLGLS